MKKRPESVFSSLKLAMKTCKCVHLKIHCGPWNEIHCLDFIPWSFVKNYCKEFIYKLVLKFTYLLRSAGTNTGISRYFQDQPNIRLWRERIVLFQTMPPCLPRVFLFEETLGTLAGLSSPREGAPIHQLGCSKAPTHARFGAQ